MRVIALPVIVNRLAVKGTIAYFVIHSAYYVGRSDHVSDFRLATLCSAVHIYMNAYICCCCCVKNSSKNSAVLVFQVLKMTARERETRVSTEAKS